MVTLKANRMCADIFVLILRLQGGACSTEVGCGLQQYTSRRRRRRRVTLTFSIVSVVDLQQQQQQQHKQEQQSKHCLCVCLFIWLLHVFQHSQTTLDSTAASAGK